MSITIAPSSRPRRRRFSAALLSICVTALLSVAACGGGDGSGALVLITHDSFSATDEIIARFEREHGVKVRIVQAGDANVLVNRAILAAGNPEGDVLFGIDNLSFGRAARANVFSTYRAQRRGEIPADIRKQFADSDLVTPVDFGYVNLNFDKAAGTPPATFDDLIQVPWKGKLVVENPATSSPGLQFLASTVAHFGEGDWQAYWRALKANDVAVVEGWTEAYQTRFSLYGGDRPLVVSYTTSPAAEVFFGKLTEPPTLNVIPNDQLFRQVEAAGVLRGAKNERAARAFIDFMLTDEFQEQIPETMFVYPIMPVPTPEWWRFAAVDVRPAVLDVSTVDVERWIKEWTAIMER